MTKGTQIKERVFTEKAQVNYRALEALNQSMLKIFDSDPVKFFEEFKLGKKRKPKKNTSLIIGDLVDFYLLECRADEHEFQNRLSEQFALFDGTKGSGQVFLLADYLFEETENCLNEDNEVTLSFEDRFAIAFRRIQAEEKYKGKTQEKALEDFEKNGKAYFDTLLENIGKTVIDESLINKAESVAKLLMEDEFTRGIFKGNDEQEEYLTKFPIEWTYKCISGKEISAKSEIDILRLEHDKKTIHIMDLKISWDNENFIYSYIKYYYYLQASFYYLAVKYWAEQNGFKDYEIVPMQFIVGDSSSNNRRPIIYTTTMQDMTSGLNGFILRDNYYRGIRELVEEISWCEDTGNWNISKIVFDNKGIIPLNISYK